MIEFIALCASVVLNIVLASAIIISHKTGIDPKPLAEKDLQAIEGWIKEKFDDLEAKVKSLFTQSPAPPAAK